MVNELAEKFLTLTHQYLSPDNDNFLAVSVDYKTSSWKGRFRTTTGVTIKKLCQQGKIRQSILPLQLILVHKVNENGADAFIKKKKDKNILTIK